MRFSQIEPWTKTNFRRALFSIPNSDCRPEEHSDEGPRECLVRRSGGKLSGEKFASSALLRVADARRSTAVRKRICLLCTQGLRALTPARAKSARAGDPGPGLPSFAPFGGLHPSIPVVSDYRERNAKPEVWLKCLWLHLCPKYSRGPSLAEASSGRQFFHENIFFLPHQMTSRRNA